jgi:hypothetical protein
MRNHKTLIRGMLALAILGLVTAALVASPVGAATTVTKKKAKTIATNKVNKLAPGIATTVAEGLLDAENAIVHRDVPGTNIDIVGNSGFDLNNPNTILGSLTLPAGNWWVHTDFLAVRNTSGIVISCDLRVGGTVVDKLSSFEGDAQSNDTVSMQGVAALPSGGTAEVRCDDGAPGGTNTWVDFLDISGIEGSTLAQT